MKKHLLGVSLTVFFLGGVAFAALPSRPTLVNVLNKRPSLSDIQKQPNTIPPKNNSSGTGKVFTGSVSTGTQLSGGSKGTIYSTASGSWQEDPVLGRQNAEDVKAYREENGYITRYLKKPASTADKKNIASAVESAVKALLAEQKKMIADLRSGIIDSETEWDKRSEDAVDTYKATVLPYIDSAKNDPFEKFILGRVNLMKGLFEKLGLSNQVKPKPSTTNTGSVVKPETTISKKIADKGSFDKEKLTIVSFVRTVSDAAKAKTINEGVDSAINEFLVDEKKIRDDFYAGTIPTQATWDARIDKVFEAYKTALLPHIEGSMKKAIEGLLTNRTKMMKAEYTSMKK